MTESEHARLAARLVSRRLAQLRLEVLDRLLADLAHMRLEGFRTLPLAVGAVIADLARAHDFSLPGIGNAPSPQVTIAERHLLAAQGQVMRELASLGGGASWEDLEPASRASHLRTANVVLYSKCAHQPGSLTRRGT